MCIFKAGCLKIPEKQQEQQATTTTKPTKNCQIMLEKKEQKYTRIRNEMEDTILDAKDEQNAGRGTCNSDNKQRERVISL